MLLGTIAELGPIVGHCTVAEPAPIAGHCTVAEPAPVAGHCTVARGFLNRGWARKRTVGAADVTIVSGDRAVLAIDMQRAVEEELAAPETVEVVDREGVKGAAEVERRLKAIVVQERIRGLVHNQSVLVVLESARPVPAMMGRLRLVLVKECDPARLLVEEAVGV